MFKLAVVASVVALGGASFASAEDHEAGVPLSPAEAAGAWTVQSHGADLCAVTLGTRRSEAGFAVRVPASCGAFLPADAAGWQPTSDGMALTGADGKVLIAFDRWSNSLFVSHRSSGVDIQLRRGLPGQ